MKKVITASERLQLLGLLVLAIEQQKMVQKLEEQMHRVIACKNGYSHLTDAIYESDLDIDGILHDMGITVQEEE